MNSKEYQISRKSSITARHMTLKTRNNLRSSRTAQETLLLYREIIAVFTEIHIKHIKYTVWAECRIVDC
jgi:hypothetical protein